MEYNCMALFFRMQSEIILMPLHSVIRKRNGTNSTPLDGCKSSANAKIVKHKFF